MTTRTAILATVLLMAGLFAVPVHVRGQQAPNAADHERHHPAAPAVQTPTPAPPPQANVTDMSAMMARMKANDARLDALVKKLKEAQGQAQIDAIAETLTALVDDRKNTCGPMMADMTSMMNMMGAGHHGQNAPAGAKK